ncbi:MAG: hypothetical protein QOJ40_838 [Verrucomicrobiota bacterium]
MKSIDKTKATVYGLLDRVREDPRAYLRGRSLDSLADFLRGFSIAQHGRTCGHYTTQGEPPFHDFTVWFELHHHQPSAGWYPAIMTESRTTKGAYNRFFNHLTAYRSRVLKFRCSFAISPVQRKHYVATLRSPAPKHLRLSRYAGERCIFVHACWQLRHGWQYHTGFRSMKQCKRWLARVYAFTPSQWERAGQGADSR